jgi:sulfonate transport system substrate-binding protein
VIDENREFFLATSQYAAANADVIHALLSDLAQTEAYASTHQAEMVRLMAPAMGMDPRAVGLAVGRLSFGVQPVDAKILASQQEIADTFARLHLIPGPIDVKDARPPHSF